MTLAAALEISLLFVCIWGFIAILLTAEFAAPVVVLCIAALIAGYAIRRKGWRPSPLISNLAAIFVFIIAAGIFSSTYNLLSATIHLFLFLQVTKYTTRTRLSENRWCYVISLFNIIGASVITTTFTFGPVLLVYVLLMMISLRLYVMAREWERVHDLKNTGHGRTSGGGGVPERPFADAGAAERISAAAAISRRGFLDRLKSTRQTRDGDAAFRGPGVPRSWRARLRAHAKTKYGGAAPSTSGAGASANFPAAQSPQSMVVPRGIIVSGLVLTGCTLALSAALFSIIPRLATQNLFQNYGRPQEESSVSAFSENVEFGAFTEIQQDEKIALFVQPLQAARPDYVRMRGVALDTFDGKSWRRSSGSFTRSGDYVYQPGFTTQQFPTDYKFRVLQPPGVTRFLFGDSYPLSLSISRNFLYQVDRLSQSIALLEMPPKEIQYEVVSMHEDLSARTDPAALASPDRPVSFLVPRTFHQVDPANEAERQDEEDPSAFSAFLATLREIGERFGDDRYTTATKPAEPDAHTTGSDNLHAGNTAGNHAGHTAGPQPDRATAGHGTDPRDESSSHGARGRSSRDEDNPYERLTTLEGHRMRRLSGPEILQRYLNRCLELPENLQTGRVPALAHSWTDSQPTTFTKAASIERHLRTEFGYSLKPRATGNYIESFLFDVREGHCEYFSTSMAVMLRNLGIPARVVNGFYSTEWNPLSGNFTVRQKDAHSWVEAWMGDDYGWMTFDPTPPSGVGRRIMRGALVEGMSRLIDAVRMRWYRYIIDYSFSDQVEILKKLARWRAHMQQVLKDMSITGVTSKDARTIEHNISSIIDWRPVAIACLVIMVLLVWQITRWVQRRKRRAGASVRFYDDFLRQLATHGITMAPGETPREFAQRVAQIRPEWREFIAATDLYYEARYLQAAEPTPEQKNRLAQLKRALRQRRQRPTGQT